MKQTVFANWKNHHADVWGRHAVQQQHNLQNHELFGDEALARLIENYPREDYSLVKPGSQSDEQHALWREGDMAGVSGEQVLEAIREGFLWLNLRNLHRQGERYRHLSEQVFGEMRQRVPDFDIGNCGMTLLITSPLAQTYYHLDVPGQSLWQLRGRKRVYLYPASAPFVTDETLEGVVMQETEEDIPFSPWFDEFARVVELEPGFMLHWPQFAPHRVENLDMLNVSLTTEHWSDEIRRNYKVRYANGLLRRQLGMTPQSAGISGPAYHAKALLQALWRRAGLGDRHRWARTVNFRLAPEAPEQIADITPYELQPE